SGRSSEHARAVDLRETSRHEGTNARRKSALSSGLRGSFTPQTLPVESVRPTHRAACRGGETGRRTGLKILGLETGMRVRSTPPALKQKDLGLPSRSAAMLLTVAR